MDYDAKMLVHLECFGDRIGREQTLPGDLLIGKRNLGVKSSITRVGKLSAIKPQVKNLLVGVVAYQGLEFLLERSLCEAWTKIGVAFSRLYNSFALLAKTRRYVFGDGSRPPDEFEESTLFHRKRLRAS